MRHKECCRRADSDAQGHKRAEFADDLCADQRADQANDEPRQHHPAGSSRAIDAVHDVSDQKGQGIGEGTPGEPLAKEELDQNIRGDHNCGHGKDAGEVCACHM